MVEKTIFAPKPPEGKPWDVAIIGSGPAGLTAAIYTTRGAASTILFAGNIWGGQLMLTTDVDNFPGFPEGIQGPDLMKKMRVQAERFGAEFVDHNVDAVEFFPDGKPHRITADNKEYLAKTVIIAAGAKTKWLGVPGEDKFRGRGISSCAPCDAPFFKGRDVAVVGGGDAAMEEALVLTRHASMVTIIHRRDEFRASVAMQKKVLENKKIKVLWNSVVEEFLGENTLKGVRIKDTKTGETKNLDFDGVFVAVGHDPSTEVFKGQLELDERGYVKRLENGNWKMETSAEGVFVAGDVHDYTFRQAITAAGFGCQAAMEILRYLEETKSNG